MGANDKISNKLDDMAASLHTVGFPRFVAQSLRADRILGSPCADKPNTDKAIDAAGEVRIVTKHVLAGRRASAEGDADPAANVAVSQRFTPTHVRLGRCNRGPRTRPGCYPSRVIGLTLHTHSGGMPE